VLQISLNAELNISRFLTLSYDFTPISIFIGTPNIVYSGFTAEGLVFRPLESFFFDWPLKKLYLRNNKAVRLKMAA
jgi:hypothetical protein